MALSVQMTKALLPRLKKGSRVASMGYPDWIAPLDLLEPYLDVRSIEYRKDSEAICKRHGIAFRGIPDAHSVFAALGCELDVYDIVQERGCEILCDLNSEEFFPNLRNPLIEYDFVLDVGTLEHCFNLGYAIHNMANLLKCGGIIIHENPFNWGNHGFVGLQPTFYADWYGQRGFKLHDLKLVLRDGRVGDVPHTKRFQFTEQEANTFAIAERTEKVPTFWPMQSKYRPVAGDRADNKENVNG